MHTIEVKTASAQYTVHVGSGLFSQLAGYIAGGTQKNVFVLTSAPIWATWGKQFLSAFLPDAPPVILFLPVGEAAKRIGELDRLAEEMAAAGADRTSLLIAFGGGVVGDVGGFLAAIYMRGIAYLQVPTTLLAQVDSSVGGKTGVNLAAGKNLVGAFYHPVAVLADVHTLTTLPPRELRAGLVETVKAAILGDAELFALLETEMPRLLAEAPDENLLSDVVARSVAIKAAVVGEDEREGGVRMILNLGHTIGHAIEAVTGYTAVLHGEAVGWGMLPAFTIARARGLITAQEETRMRALVAALGPLPRFTATAEQLVTAAGRDKKNRAGVRRFVLPRGIGHAVVVDDVTDAELLSATEAMLAAVRLA